VLGDVIKYDPVFIQFLGFANGDIGNKFLKLIEYEYYNITPQVYVRMEYKLVLSTQRTFSTGKSK